MSLDETDERYLVRLEADNERLHDELGRSDQALYECETAMMDMRGSLAKIHTWLCRALDDHRAMTVHVQTDPIVRDPDPWNLIIDAIAEAGDRI